MKRCKQCGFMVDDAETYCSRCGSGKLLPADGGASSGAERAVASGASSMAADRPIQQMVNKTSNFEGNLAPSKARTPQPAPAGYRNPNANRVKSVKEIVPEPKVESKQLIDDSLSVDVEVVNEEKPRVGRGGKSKGTKGSGKEPKQPKKTKEPKTKREKQPPLEGTVTVKEWILMYLKLLVPIYNIIFIIKAWKGEGIKESMSNYIKVYVITMVINILISIGGMYMLSEFIMSNMW